jgi:hypothetical protein
MVVAALGTGLLTAVNAGRHAFHASVRLTYTGR